MLSHRQIASPSQFTLVLFHCDITNNSNLRRQSRLLEVALHNFFPATKFIVCLAAKKDLTLKTELLAQPYDALVVSHTRVIDNLLTQTQARIEYTRTFVLAIPSNLAKSKRNNGQFNEIDCLSLDQIALALHVEFGWDIQSIPAKGKRKFIPLLPLKLDRILVNKHGHKILFGGYPLVVDEPSVPP